MSEPSHEKGTMRAYVIGFILSLTFTLVPYQLVSKQTITGTALLATILIFAIAQMLVQVTFFLHLGRGPKPRWNLYFFVSTVGIILVVVGGSILIINNLHYNMKSTDQVKKLIGDEAIYQINGEKTGACRGQYKNHRIIFKDNQVDPIHTDASKCDTLTFINEDSKARTVTFGAYPQDLVYAGESDLAVQKGRNETITLSEVGTYLFYDKLQVKAIGDFVVSP